MKEFIEIPFGAKDSELGGWEYNIPDGMEATIVDNKIVVKKKESEDERIRKTLLGYFNDQPEQYTFRGLTNNEVIAWLEKQGKSKFEQCVQKGDKIVTNEDGTHFNVSQLERVATKEPKFKVGDWVILDRPILITKVEDTPYNTHQYWTSDGTWFGDATKAKLWTIQDAKDGDILYFNDDTIVIFKDLYNATTFHSYCHIENGIFDFSIDELPDWWEGEGFKPATKEQRDLLFQKMKEAGYEWDADKKELKKIKQNMELTDFESALFTAFSDAWQQYLDGEEVNVAQWAKEHSTELLEVANQNHVTREKEPKKVHVIDEGKAEMDYCFTKMMNGEKVSPTWSEEDEENLNQLHKLIVKKAYEEYEIDTEDETLWGKYAILDNWLKLLKGRVQPNQWKPSEEQLNALNALNLNGDISYVGQQKQLIELYEQLEKL